MKMYRIVELFRDIVGTVSSNLTTELQAYDSKITGVHYMHGHPMEIIETLTQKGDTQMYRYDRYPLIALFQDFPERVASASGFQSEVTLHLIIARSTMPDYKADQRYDYNFNPVLYPVYTELMRQINYNKAFTTRGAALIQHTKWDRLYWGRGGLYGNESNIFNDWIDCIEIKDLTLKVNLKLC